MTNPLLGRPFALYDTYLDAQGHPAGFDVVYTVVGKMTGLMSTWKPGDLVEVWGPLGNGFPVPRAKRLLMVAGGIGFTPFLAVAREALGRRRYRPAAECSVESVAMCYGVRSADYFAGLDEFGALGVDVRLSTDDGSRGHRGLVTDLAREWLENLNSATDVANAATGHPRSSILHPPSSIAIYCCGPEPMMHAVAGLTARHRVPCWLSLETPMACGFGACFSCVTRVKLTDGGWDYRRVCVEGPIFPAEELLL
jgi:dihydroorotate dehydrogenase electron transfer subunit